MAWPIQSPRSYFSAIGSQTDGPRKPLRTVGDGIRDPSADLPLLARSRSAHRGDTEETKRQGQQPATTAAGSRSDGMAAKAISSPVPVEWYPSLAVVMVSVGLMLTASFFIYEATSSRRSRSLAKEIATAAVASVFLGFGSLFVLLASGVYV
ncbi:hypothetical protein GQ55_4G108200 [Panicum hallii var. hallii]|uniref:Dolichyl-diphosphooligosaccharide-protein glycosyltransferase subunit OST5 n=3 Tax=Panicum hallii TaxID=206008 RepID=A0A2T7DXD6_9POAL|nr:hypothetical protein GQ55_4G108200 [Panicum hallii var. hallii]PVH47651.1 hypothetical protein PAHAL_4G107600 [Panicum hallii]